MSNPLYNPFGPGNQSSTQGQYGLRNVQAEREPWGASHLGPGSSFSSSGASSAIPDNSRGMPPSLMSQPSFRPERSKAIMDEGLETSIDMHISRAREEVRVFSNLMQQPIDKGTRYTSTQWDEFRSSGTGMASCPMSSTSASLGHSHSDIESGSRSSDWSSNYKRPTADDSKFYSSSDSSNYGGASRSNAPSKRNHDMQSIPGLDDYPMPDKCVPSTGCSQRKWTSESAANILLDFGLEKEDLDHLLSLPEDQMTPDNLPFILRQIRIQKAKRATTTVQPKPFPEPQPTRRISGIDHHSLGSSGGPGIQHEKMSSAVPKPSKVIDYGHTSKYFGGVGEDIGRTSDNRASSGGSGSMVLMDTYNSYRHSEEPLQKNTTEVKSSVLVSSHDQASSATCPSSLYSSLLSSVTPSNDQTKRLQTQPDQTYQKILSSFSLPNKDTDIRVLKSEAFKPVPLKEPEVGRQSTSTTQSSCALPRGVHPSRPGLVLSGRNDNSGTKDKIKTQGSTVAEQMKKQQTQQQVQKQSLQQRPDMPTEQQLKQQMPNQQTQHKQPVLQSGQARKRPVFLISNLRPATTPAALPSPIPSLFSLSPVKTKTKPPGKVAVSKGVPTLAMMHDYAATTPRIFPHTCSLCYKECTQMKDWISHQNTSGHLDNCRLLRRQYPNWDGEISLGSRAAGKDDKPLPSTSAQTYQQRQQKTRHRSRSRSHSPSPNHHHSLEGRQRRRSRSSSRSRSPHSSRYTYSSRSRSRSPWYYSPTSSHYRSHSGSTERRSPRRSDRRRSSPRRSDERWSPPRRSDGDWIPPRRSNERWNPPRRSDDDWIPARRSTEKRYPPRRSDKRGLSPGKIDKRPYPPRKIDKGSSSPRKSDGRLSPTRSSNERQTSPRRSHERRSSSAERSSPQQKKLSNAEKLAKKLLQTSAVQSLSKQSNLAAVVETLAPALLAELVKIKKKKKGLTSKASKAKPSQQKSEASSSTKTKFSKSSPPTMVKLAGVRSSVSHNDMVAAVEHFGKTKSVVLFRSKLEAIVCFEKEEDAKKLKSLKRLDVKGVGVTVVRDTETEAEERKKGLQKKSATSSVSTPQTTESTTTTTTQKVLLPTPCMPQLKGPLPSGAKKATSGKPKSKVLVSKAKTIVKKQTAKLPAKGAIKKGIIKQESSNSSESKAIIPENQPDTSDSKQKPIPIKSETSDKQSDQSVLVVKDTVVIDKSENRTVTEPTKDIETVTAAKVSASKAETTSTTQKPQTPAYKFATAVAKERVEETATKVMSVPSKSTASVNSKSKESETKVQESAMAPEESMETHLELIREEAKATEDAVAKSDHKMSAEGNAAQTVESETEMQISSKMHLHPQRHEAEVSQAKSLEIDSVSTIKDLEKRKEEGKEDDLDKATVEEEDNIENYQILDSLDDQTDDQMDDGDQDGISETQQTGPAEGQTLNGENQPFLDSVDNIGKARLQECSEMEIDGSFQVLDSVTEDQAALNQEDSLLVQDEFAVKDAEDKDQEGNKANVQELDTGNKHTATEDNSQNLETPSEQISIEDTKPIEEEEDTYQVVDCLEDQSTTTETKSETDSKEIRNKEGEVTVREDDGPSKRSGPTTTTSKNEEKEKTPNKQDRMVKKYDTQTQMDTTVGVSTKDKEIPEATEEMVFEVVDSVEDETVQNASTIERPGRRRSSRGKKGDRITLNLTEVSQKPNADEEATFEILDSVEDETADNEPVVTTRSTRGKKERTSRRDASNEKTKKEETRVRTRRTPVRQSQEKTPKKEEKAPPKESATTKKSDIVVREVREEDATNRLVNSLEVEVVKDEQPVRGRKGRRGKPKKAVKTTKKDSAALKKGNDNISKKVPDEEEATYQILDSVEDEMINDGPFESLKKESISKNYDKPKNEEEEEEEEPMYQIVDSLEDDQEELTATEVCDNKEQSNETSTTEGASAEKGDTPTCCTTLVESSEKVITKDECLSQTVDDLEDEHHDSSAAEESGTRNKESSSKTDIEEEDRSTTKPQNNTAVQLTKEREARTTRERGERERRSSSRGGGDRGGTSRAKGRRKNEVMVEKVIAKELVTLDKLDGDERGKERERDEEITEGELEALVTLDEFIEEEEDGKAEQYPLETRPYSQEDQSLDSLNPETLVTLDEASCDEEEKPDEEQAEKTLRCAEHQHNADTEEIMTFVTVDEVGEEEEEAVTTRTRSRAKKRARQAPERKSTRGKKVGPKDKNPPTSSQDVQSEVEKAEVEAAGRVDVSVASGGGELQPEHTENQNLDGSVEEGRSGADIKVVCKQRRELDGPEWKRSRSQSPSVAADFKLQPFKPNQPLGQESMVPVSGFFCNLCSIFYLNERTAKELHCSSKKHYENLQKHYQKLREKASRSSTQGPQGSISD